MRKWMMVMLVAGTVLADKKAKDEEKLDPEKQIKIIEQASSSMLIMEYELRYDKGQPPSGADTMYWCHNCNTYHSRQVGQELIDQERPLEVPAFLISPTTVVSTDITLNPRFIKRIRARFGGELVNANITDYAVNSDAVFYELEKPIKGMNPLKFDQSRKGPYLAVTHSRVNGHWTTGTEPLSEATIVTSDSRKYSAGPPSSLIVDHDGNAVTLSMQSELPVDGSWKKEPKRWKKVSTANFDKRLKNIEKMAGEALPRVSLHFRSPKSQKSDPYSSRYYGSSSGSATEINAIGVCLDGKRVLILASLSREQTARLEKIDVFDAKGKAHKASFKGTLKEYGALLAVLDKSLGKTVNLAGGDIMQARRKLLARCEVHAAGEQRIAYYERGRITAIDAGHKNLLYPKFDGSQKDTFFFNDDDELVILPLILRQKLSLRRGRYHSAGYPTPTLASVIKPILDASEKNFDSSNVPVGKDEENRIAWMGVVLQKMNRELARANRVSELTRDGDMGALVTFVYPDSPAAKAGIEQGMILLRLIVDSEPKPIDVRIESEARRSSFRWESMDQMPVEYFDRTPPPWPSVDSEFNRTLTDVGIGTKYVVEIFHDGKELNKKFVVAECPEHFDSAARYKSEELGITARNLTFEVRRHIQKKNDDPGVVISKIETGSKAAVAGLKPYELITNVNGKKINNVKEFEAALVGWDLDFSIDRMSVSRQVRIHLEEKKAKKEYSEKK